MTQTTAAELQSGRRVRRGRDMIRSSIVPARPPILAPGPACRSWHQRNTAGSMARPGPMPANPPRQSPLPRPIRGRGATDGRVRNVVRILPMPGWLIVSPGDRWLKSYRATMTAAVASAANNRFSVADRNPRRAAPGGCEPGQSRDFQKALIGCRFAGRSSAMHADQGDIRPGTHLPDRKQGGVSASRT
jgi:hypothetical protein